MKANPADFELESPRTLAAVLPLLNDYAPIAGGTEIMVQFSSGHLDSRRFVSIWNLPELRQITVTPEAIRIGAGSTFTDIRRHLPILEEFPLLTQAAGFVGSIANQNRATIGGNLVNASPAADSSPSLLAYEAEVELISEKGTRTLPYSSFHLSYKETALKKDELLSAIILKRATSPPCPPPLPGSRGGGNNGGFHFFRKVGARNAQAISKIVFAGLAQMTDGKVAEIRIALGSVAYAPIRCASTEAFLKGKVIDEALIEEARKTLAREISPIDDIRSTADYRATVAGNVLEEFLKELANEPS